MNYKLYTHNDLDGVGCAILAKLAWQDYVEIKYCNSPDEVTERLCKDDNRHADLVFVTDCSFNYEKVYNNNHRVINKIRLFDHHATALPLVNKSEYFVVETYRKDGKPTCGTEIFYNYLKERKGFTRNCHYFVEQVRLYDTWEWKEGSSNIPNYLSMLLYTDSISAFCDNFAIKLLRGNMNDLSVFTDAERAVLQYEERRQQKMLDKALKNVYIIHTDKYSWGITFSEVNMSLIGQEICDTFDVDIAASINLNNEILSVRTTKNNIDLGALMKSDFNGGGHPKAAGTPLHNQAFNVIKDIIKPKRVESFSKGGKNYQWIRQH